MARENFWKWSICLWHRYGDGLKYVLISKFIKLYTLNMDSFYMSIISMGWLKTNPEVVSVNYSKYC